MFIVVFSLDLKQIIILLISYMYLSPSKNDVNHGIVYIWIVG